MFKKKTIQSSSQITINASKEKIWYVLTSINNWPNWNAKISHAKLNGELEPNTTFDWKTNGIRIHAYLHKVEPFENFGWHGKTLAISAVHNFRLADTNEKIEVSTEEYMNGFLVWLFGKKIQNALKKDLQNWLSMLKNECER